MPLTSPSAEPCLACPPGLPQILACTNAVRVNPDVLSDASCFASVQAELTSPPRLALNLDALLTAAAKGHNDLMVSTNTLSHRLTGELGLGDRVTAAGYNWWGVAENIASGYGSAKDVVSGWLCSAGHRANMFSCDYTDIGIASDTSAKYYTQLPHGIWMQQRDLQQLRHHGRLAALDPPAAVDYCPTISQSLAYASASTAVPTPSGFLPAAIATAIPAIAAGRHLHKHNLGRPLGAG
ncbi:hypothetical protein GPECTOR_115g334 [Gonium pectorale]|uniref:SCP domain-containing protein n=1 Tax=Gonium pectorale TaxID=33097 RepID=A0A150G0J7_GONPE|nr:hypothetical protein GPECTOR_115g334 [Gonium pectorale]|eukprot:KXZ42840.1 hypothetical protein GPECTOR_115g334 [Gonium pectorale]